MSQNQFIQSAFDALCEVADQRATELEQFEGATPLDSSDDETISASPIYDSFLNSIGPNGIHKMTNFSPTEVTHLHKQFEPIIAPVWYRGRGKRSSYKLMDVLFMTLTVYKNGGAWDFLSAIFKIQTTTFQRMIWKYVETVGPEAYRSLVECKDDYFTMNRLRRKQCQFNHFGEARYATDVIFQQSNRPMGRMQETKIYFSGKHHLYGFKTEVSVLPNGLSIGSTKAFPGSVADIEIFRANKNWHERGLEKRVDETAINDDGELSNSYPDTWAILVDKGYTGLANTVRAIIPDKKPANGYLTTAQRTRNHNISSDRVIVENFFGRLCTFNLFGSKWRWDEEKYNDFFRFGMALTNAHIIWNPLRTTDGTLYKSLMNRLCFIGESQLKKRLASQNSCRERRRQRISEQIPDTSAQDHDSEDFDPL